MNKPIIHFAHANGFPAKSYQKLFSQLEDEYRIGYLERHAHNPDFPVTPGWEHLKEELRATIEARYDRPVIGMGHSFGGLLHLKLAAEKPELYQGIVLLDAMVISRLSSFVIRLLRGTDLFDKYSPALKTVVRRNHFESREQAFEHYGAKEKFAEFDQEMLRDYVEHGLTETAGGFELFIEPLIEADIYRTIPADLPDLQGRIKLPTIYIGGDDSREARLARLGFMKKNFSFQLEFVEGTHLFPFEKPQQTAKLIKNFLENHIY